MSLHNAGNPKDLSFDEVLELLDSMDEDQYKESFEDNPYKPLNFNDED
jgi:hypothetical protein